MQQDLERAFGAAGNDKGRESTDPFSTLNVDGS
jgi:hypothetical protein